MIELIPRPVPQARKALHITISHGRGLTREWIPLCQRSCFGCQYFRSCRRCKLFVPWEVTAPPAPLRELQVHCGVRLFGHQSDGIRVYRPRTGRRQEEP